MIFGKIKLITAISIAIFIEILFSTGKNIPAAYGEYGEQGELIFVEFSPNRWFSTLDQKIQGGPCCGTGPGRTQNGNPCVESYPGKIPGNFTSDEACQKVYGSDSKYIKTLGPYRRRSYYICGSGFGRDETNIIQCLIPPTATPTIPLPPGPPCAEWKDGDPKSGVCLKVGTSLFQGGTPSPAGNISTDPSQFIVRIFTIILGFAGGIALLLIISAAYKLLTSKGKPESIQQGKDQLTSAIVGLVFIIFSFLIFQLIFVDVLKIPGITK